MRLVVIGSLAAARVVFICAVSTSLCLCAEKCNMLLDSAHLVFVHNALIIEDCANLELKIVYDLVKNYSLSFIWCQHIHQ